MSGTCGRCPACGGILALEVHHADINLTVYVCVVCHHRYLTQWDIAAGLQQPGRKGNQSPRRKVASPDYQVTALSRLFTLLAQRHDMPDGAEMFRMLDARVTGASPVRPRSRRIGHPRRSPEEGDDLVMTYDMAMVLTSQLKQLSSVEEFSPYGAMIRVILKGMLLIAESPLEFQRYIEGSDFDDFIIQSANIVPAAYKDADREQLETELGMMLLTVMTGFIRHARDLKGDYHGSL